MFCTNKLALIAIVYLPKVIILVDSSRSSCLCVTISPNGVVQNINGRNVLLENRRQKKERNVEEKLFFFSRMRERKKTGQTEDEATERKEMKDVCYRE